MVFGVEVEGSARHANTVRRRIPAPPHGRADSRWYAELQRDPAAQDQQSAGRRRQFNAGGKVKMPSNSMSAFARQDVPDREGSVPPRQTESAFVHNRPRKACVASMTTAILEALVLLLDIEVLRVGFLEHAEQPPRAEFVLFLAVDADRVVR